MSDFPCSMTQGKNALVIWTSIVTVVSHHKLINFHLCQLPEDLFIPEHLKLFLLRHGAEPNINVLLGKAQPYLSRLSCGHQYWHPSACLLHIS